MSFGLSDHSEAKPFVEASRRVVDFDDLQFHRNAPAVRLIELSSNQLHPNPSVLMVWCNLDDSKKDAGF